MKERRAHEVLHLYLEKLVFFGLDWRRPDTINMQTKRLCSCPKTFSNMIAFELYRNMEFVWSE
eukprot:scaffold11589_cov117-Cylindrotheca_fusiformis.AAC.12